MPFVNDAQRRACWAKYRADINMGVKPKWDCKKWENETKRIRGIKRSLKRSRSQKRSPKRSANKRKARRSRIRTRTRKSSKK